MEAPSRFVFIEKVLAPLSLAVHPMDRTRPSLAPAGKMDVTVEPLGVKPMDHIRKRPKRNPSGYWVIVGASPRQYKVKVKGDRRADYYLPRFFSVTLPSNGLDPIDPPLDLHKPPLDLHEEVTLINLEGALLAEVKLIPNAAYPFPSDATLVRIRVIDESSGSPVPVPDAKIRVFEQGAAQPATTFRTGPKGQSVLFCNKMTRDRIVEINGRAFDGVRQLRVEAIHPEAGQGAVDLTVKDFKPNPRTIKLT